MARLWISGEPEGDASAGLDKTVCCDIVCQLYFSGQRVQIEFLYFEIVEPAFIDLQDPFLEARQKQIEKFIRLVRLKKAADLLSEGNWRINEVCFLTGFNKPSYFSSCFRKQFGILPKDFVRKVSEDAKENGNGTQRNGRA